MSANTDVVSRDKPAAKHEPRNFLVTFLLACMFGVLGLRHFYLGDKKLGWIRTGLFVGGYLLLIVAIPSGLPILLAFGSLAILAAWVWAIIDFFFVYNAVKTDAEGQPLTTTARDKKWAKVLYIVTIASVIVSFLAMVVFAGYIQQEVMKGDWRTRMNDTQQPFDQSEFNTDEFLRQLEQQSPSY